MANEMKRVSDLEVNENLLTAALSWVLSIYPTLNRCRLLPLVMPYPLHLAERAGGERFQPRVRLRADMLRGAIRDFSVRIGSKAFLNLPGASAEEVFKAYARDHLHDEPGWERRKEQ